jgi:excisionase family DNA binding protein
MQEFSDVLTTQQAAKLLGVSITSVQNLAIAGEIEFWRTAGGHRRIKRSTIEALLRKKRRPDGDKSGTLNVSPVKILLADDDPNQVAFFQTIIDRSERFVDLTVATDASVALIMLERQRPDLVVTDLLMEPFNGYHLIKALKKDPVYSSIDVVAISAMSKDEARSKGEIPEWVTFFQKPVSPDRFLGYLEAVHSRLLKKAESPEFY